MDLLERRLKKQTDKLKLRAEEAFKLKAPSGDIFVAKELEREVQKFKLKVLSLFIKKNLMFGRSSERDDAHASRAIAGFDAYDEPGYRLAVCESRPDSGETVVLLRRDVPPRHCITIWHGP